MEKILNELMKSETPYNEGTHRRISSMLNVPMRKVSEMATRFRESLEQIGMVRNQMSRMVHPENREQLEQQRRELLCPLPTAEEWREADARSLAAQFGTGEDNLEQGESLEAVLSEVGSMPAIEKARLQEGASARNFIAYQALANQIKFKYARQ